jgi:hypothetical protein
VDHSILRALAGEVHRRTCPGCGKSLRDAVISASFAAGDRIQLSFHCRRCRFEGGGEIVLTPRIREEAARHADSVLQLPRLPAPPITADEVLAVHEILANWRGDFSDLTRPEPGLLPPG